MGIRNSWTLNIDELLVADQLKEYFKKTEYDVFFPLNSQMKDIDLVIMNVKTTKAKTIQVKGSRTYIPRKSEVERYGEGSAAWFKIGVDSIFKTSNKLDYYVFALHSFIDSDIKKEIQVNYLIISSKDFQALCSKKKTRSDGKSYDFIIWIDPKGKRVFEMRNFKEGVVPLSNYLNNWSSIKV